MPRGITGRGVAEMTVQRTVGAGRVIQRRAGTSGERPVRRLQRPAQAAHPCGTTTHQRARAGQTGAGTQPLPTAGVPNNE